MKGGNHFSCWVLMCVVLVGQASNSYLTSYEMEASDNSPCFKSARNVLQILTDPQTITVSKDTMKSLLLTCSLVAPMKVRYLFFQALAKIYKLEQDKADPEKIIMGLRPILREILEKLGMSLGL